MAFVWKAIDWKAVRARVGKFIVDNFLPLCFAVAIIWALAWPAPGKAVVGVTVRTGLQKRQRLPAPCLLMHPACAQLLHRRLEMTST